MKIVSQLFRLNRYLNILAQNSPLSVARLEVLRLIKKQNPITLRQLCDIQQVSMPTMSKLVDELQTAALIIRAQSKDDARQRWIVPTQKGILVLAEMELSFNEFWAQRLSGIEAKKCTEIENILSQLTELLQPDPAGVSTSSANATNIKSDKRNV